MMIANCANAVVKSVSSSRIFFDDLAELLNISVIEDWYKVSTVQLDTAIGNTHNDVPAENLLTNIFPHTNWQLWRFERVSSEFWKHKENQMEFIFWLEEQLNITSKDQWHRISISQIQAAGGYTLSSFDVYIEIF
jgi:hypothetical protein